ncbi:MAG TPA: hypothetical protein VHE36_05900 [Sphingomicrobium sp.]|jgi:hypothetical protein|nr:hypothetical protein [Sphingomicrobium sp.]
MRFLNALGMILLAGCAIPEPTEVPQQPRELAGRSPGAAQRCVLIEATQSLHVSDNDRHTLLYGSGKTIWASSLGPDCGFSRNDVLVSEPIGSYYCRGDIIRSFDRYTRIPGPSCRLGDFVPYTR